MMGRVTLSVARLGSLGMVGEDFWGGVRCVL